MSGHLRITPKTIVIRDIETLDEMHEVETLQREIWGVSDLDVLPALALRPQKEVGATLIGAFAEGRAHVSGGPLFAQGVCLGFREY